MWCPEGYALYSEFHFLCVEAGYKLFPSEGYLAEMRANDWAEYRLEDDPSIRALATGEWLRTVYLGRTDTEKTLCSPRGEFVRVGGKFFVRVQYTGTKDAWIVSPRTASFEDVFSFLNRRLSDRFSSSPRSPWLNMTNDGRVKQIPFRKALFNYFGSSYRASLRRKYRYIFESRRNTAPFVGWQLCFRKETLPATAAEMLDLFSSELAETDCTDTPHDGRKPFRNSGMQAQIRQILEERFPRGTQNIPAKTLQAALADQFEKLPHEDTVRRAIGRKKTN